MPQVYSIPVQNDLPHTITGAKGVEIPISDQALLTQINIIGDPIAERAGMHGNIVEAGLDAAFTTVVVADSNAYAGITQANGPDGRGYDIATIGKGNAGAEIGEDDGAHVAQIILETGCSVIVNVQDLSQTGMTKFVYEMNDELATMDPSENGMLFGFASLSGTLPRRRMSSDGRAVATTNCFASRAFGNNVRIVNVCSGAYEIPIEFEQKAKNTIAMVNVNSKTQENMATRLGRAHAAKILANVNNDFGLGRAGITHGTYFNPGELDDGDYIVTVKPLKSRLGFFPKPDRDLNEATRTFMKLLHAKRQEAADRKREAATKSLIDRVTESEKVRAERIRIRTATAPRKAGTVAPAAGVGRRASSGRSFIIVDRDRHAATIDGASRMEVLAAVSSASARPGIRQINSIMEIDGAVVAERLGRAEVIGFARSMEALRQRAGVAITRGFITGMMAIEAHDPEMGAEFKRRFRATESETTPIGRAVHLLRDRTRTFTQHQTADILFQAFIAFRDGAELKEFAGNKHLPMLAKTAAPANDDAALDIAA